MKNVFYLVVLFLIITSCGNDDDGILDSIPPRALSEVAIENEDEIVAFLKTHFYNYDEFETPSVDFDYKIRFDTIAGINSDKESIFDSKNLITETITVESSSLGRDDGEVIELQLYTLVARQGEGGAPTIGDFTILNYTGLLLNGIAFDASSNQPAKQYLSSVVPGYGKGVGKFKTGVGPTENGDGTISYDSYGIGAIFMPSGLAYFDRPPQGGGIPAYSPLVFLVDVLDYEPNTDFDGDGIPSILEDVNGNGILTDDNTDSESEPATVFLANHNDTDDDQDGIPTIEEINLDDEGNFLSFRYTYDPDIPDHLYNNL